MPKSISNKNILGTLTVNNKTVPTISYSDSAPSSPASGDMWIRTTDMVLFHYYSDGSSSQWAEVRKADDTNLGARVTTIEATYSPSGVVQQYAGTSAPNGWLLCDGSAVSRSTYSSLFSSIGTQYGIGNGTTTFNLPDLRGRVVVGLDSSQSEFNTMGETGGAKTHTLSVTEMPSHTHVQDSHTHTFSGTTSTNGNHNHISTWASITGYNYVGSGGNSNWPFGGGSNAQQRDLQPAGDHSHTYSGTTSTQSVSTNQNTGGGGAHNNLQPYIVLNYIIKT